MRDRGNRLNPLKNSGRYYILTHLKKINEKIVNSYINNGVLLDFGCGNSPYKVLYEKKCTQYLKADFSGNPLADVYISSNGKLPVEDNSMDYVLSTQVLEHVENPDAYLAECFRVLKKDGLLLLSTHGHWKYHPDPTDFWRWTIDGLVKTIELNKFKLIEVYGLMGLTASGLQLFQDGIFTKVPLRLRGIFFRLITYAQIKLDKWETNAKDASVYFTISRKA